MEVSQPSSEVVNPERRGIVWAVVCDPTTLPLVERRHPNGEPHHVTLRFGVDLDDPQVQALMGREFEVVIFEECWNNRVQAWRVVICDPIVRDYAKPNSHITISWAAEASPAESNTMIESGCFLSYETILHPVRCRIEEKELV